MDPKELTISGGWSPRYAHLAELDRVIEIGDMDTTNELIAGNIDLLKAIVEDYQEHLAKREAAAVGGPQVLTPRNTGQDLF